MAICHCILPWVLIIIPYLLFKSNTLNIIHTGDNIARGLGVRLSERTFNIILYRSDVIICCCSSSRFNFVYRINGPAYCQTYRWTTSPVVLPIAILVGACLLVIADTIGKIVLQPGGVPAGIVVAIIGAPYFLYLMYKTKNV